MSAAQEGQPAADAADEYRLEIRGLQRQLAHLQETDGDPVLIDEYDAELRNLTALYRAALETLDAGRTDARLRDALEQLGFGDWTLKNVYGFVYDLAMELPNEPGRDLATMIDGTDFPGSLLEALHD
ncbi:MAG: hypothetical protein JOZ46_07565 [Candidatus Dormibacteraeota bacterium]|nr:hypothetical protein [Candidatus Dormibacteraeota bacterium]MBV9525656.1 hypothetical protein [Candidatus Dormibacteraeota bacterium]